MTTREKMDAVLNTIDRKIGEVLASTSLAMYVVEAKENVSDEDVDYFFEGICKILDNYTDITKSA